jgi:Papain fold toxin 1, glutamine deamidase
MAKARASSKGAQGFLRKLTGDLLRPARGLRGPAPNVPHGKANPPGTKGAKAGAGRSVDDVVAAAKRTLAECNPKYDAGEMYRFNCSAVAQVYELRRRGLDVHPRPLFSGKVGGNGQGTVEDLWGRKMDYGTKDDIVKAFQEAGPGSRGVITIKWHMGGGHVFNVENIGGKVHFVDGQPPGGQFDAEHYFERGDFTFYARLDDLPTPPKHKIEDYTE